MNKEPCVCGGTFLIDQKLFPDSVPADATPESGFDIRIACSNKSRGCRREAIFNSLGERVN